MLIPILQQADGGIGHKALQLSAMIRLASDRHSIENGRHRPFGTIIQIKVKVPNCQRTFLGKKLICESSLIKTGLCATKKLKGDVDMPD